MIKGILFILVAIFTGTMPFWFGYKLWFPDFIYYVCAIGLLIKGISVLRKRKTSL